MKSLWCRDFSRGDDVLMTKEMMSTVLRIGRICPPSLPPSLTLSLLCGVAREVEAGKLGVANAPSIYGVQR
jgi:hypothetical protein